MRSKEQPMPSQSFTGMSLYARNGARKYLNSNERERFLQAANYANPKVKSFCLTLALTGCRLSEARSLTASSIQMNANIISIHCLKKRNHHIVREVPVPESLMQILEETHGISKLQHAHHTTHSALWPWSRTWAWGCVKAVMRDADIYGAHASPKGLRHGFGVHAIHSGVPLNMIQRWLGHAHLATTSIYANAVGPDERLIAERMWS